jgi:type I restriction enzyme S subunit
VQAHGGAGLAHITKGKFEDSDVTVPPMGDQERIVSEVDRLVSVAKEIAHFLSESVSRAFALRRGILQQAFSGRLVPQDPSDEPASALLERIKHERSSPDSAISARRLKVSDQEAVSQRSS